MEPLHPDGDFAPYTFGFLYDYPFLNPLFSLVIRARQAANQIALPPESSQIDAWGKGGILVASEV